MPSTPPSSMPLAASDDCFEDPPFDIPSSTRQTSYTSPPPYPSTTLKTSRSSTSSSQPHGSSPLRNSFTGKPPFSLRHQVEGDADMDFDLPDSFPARSRSTTASSTSSSIRNLSRTVISAGPSGIGTVTRISASPSVLSKGAVRAKTKAFEGAWEADIDLDALKGVPKGLFTLGLPKKGNVMVDPEELDELGFDLDDDEATLKAGATIKAMLPPPKPKTKSTPPRQDLDDFDTNLLLPLNLTSLTLVTKPHSKSHPRPRVSNASSTSAAGGSPDTSTSSKKSVGEAWSWDEDSPKRFSETSATSISDGVTRGKDYKTKSVDEDDDMEMGLILPDPSFFSSANSGKLVALLDQKRKPHLYGRMGADDTFRTRDESFDAGLVLENPKMELSRATLSRNKRKRGENVLVPAPRKVSTGKEKTEGEKVKAKELERGWGRPAHDLVPPQRERTQPASTSTSLRSQSVTTNQPTESSYSSTRVKEAARSRPSLDAVIMPPPSFPIPSTPSTNSRLRLQKSNHHIPPPSPSPSIARKQSVASLQDDRTSKHEPATPSRQHHSASRLTMPTVSSQARSRPSVRSTFPDSQSSSSMSTSGSGQISTPKSPPGYPSWVRVVDEPRRTRGYGDGLEREGIDQFVQRLGAKRSMRGMSGFLSNAQNPKLMKGVGHEVQPKVQGKTEVEKREKTGSVRRNRPREPALFNLGQIDKPTVVGEMIWNPEKVCWEGNESILDTFDSIPISSSARPVLIKHYTKTPPTGIASPGGPDTGFVKVVGDMKFDPERMCWVSNLDADEDDPFEGMADDEDEDPGATITRASGRKLVSVRTGLGSSERSSRVASESSAGGSVMSWGEGASGLVSDLALRRECGKARKRHEEELKGWVVRAGMEEGPEERKRREESRLWEIRRRAVDF